MSGRVIQVAPRLIYSFVGLVDGTTQRVQLGARAYFIPEAMTGEAIVRVSKWTGAADDTCNFQIVVLGSSITPEQPDVIFLDASSPVATVTVAKGAAGDPKLFTAPFSAGFPSMVSVFLLVNTLVAPSDIEFTMAVDLVVRDGTSG